MTIQSEKKETQKRNVLKNGGQVLKTPRVSMVP